MPLPFGKLDHHRLANLLGRYVGAPDPDVLVGPCVGEDAAAVRVGDQAVVAATDPITFAAERIGWYAVHVNANDVAVMGARPRWFQACLLLPPCEPDLARAIFADIHRSCRRLGVAVTGGHTEVTVGLDRPILIGTMLGVAPADRIVASDGARAGDALVVTKGIAIEGAALAALEKADALAGVLSARRIERTAGLLTRPGISVVPEAALAVQCGARAMHDPTEGGLLTGIWEMAEAAGLGVEVDMAAVPVLPEAAAVCEHFGLDIYYTLASGALLAALPEADVDAYLAALRAKRIRAARIGRFTRGERVVHAPDGDRPLQPIAADEVTKLFD